MKFTIASLPFLAFLSSALPTLNTRQSATVCGSNHYTASQVSAAANAADNYVAQGTEAGSSTYPHKYNNYEGFSFPVSGPWYEFPILESKVYNGGKFVNSFSAKTEI
jgi:hypothetical protein